MDLEEYREILEKIKGYEDYADEDSPRGLYYILQDLELFILRKIEKIICKENNEDN